MRHGRGRTAPQTAHPRAGFTGRRSRRAAAFTLVEMLVVIAVIAILAAIVLPIFNNAQRKAQEASCLANLSGISVALKLYKNDYRGYPLGSLSGNVAGLSDGTNAPYSGTAYNTAVLPNGRKTRINALYPKYIDNQHALLCPEEEGDTFLITGEDPSGSLNGQDADAVLKPGGDGSASTYDDFYNVFGYRKDNGGLGLGPGEPLLAPAGASAKAKRLSNRYAPGPTIITYCREHEMTLDPANPDPQEDAALIVRLDGSTKRVFRASFPWDTQAE